MNRDEWQRAFGDVPEAFRLRLEQTLDGLEEDRMKRRHKFSTMLAAALIAALLITGAAMAATRLGILDHMGRYADAIEPLPGAEALVGTDLGSAESEHATMVVEEAAYDGQGVMLQLRIAPKDPERDALFDEMIGPDNLDDYIVEQRPVPVPEDGEAGYFRDDGTWVEFDTYERDGVTYYTDEYINEFLGRKDGRRMINYEFELVVDGGEYRDLMPASSWDAEAQPDGSVRVWVESTAERPLDARTIDVRVYARTWADGEPYAEMEPVAFTLAAGEDERRARLVPVGDGVGERCQILGGEALFTKICGYLTVDYLYRPAEGEDMGAVIDVVDAAGQPVAGDGGWEEYPETDRDGTRHCRAHCRIQSFADLPETIWLEVRVIGGPTLGRLECEVVEE